jgi:flagellin-like hook-associated protein FlgL
MSTVPLNIARVSSQLQGRLLLGTIQTNQLDLLKVQTQLSTQQKLNRASDDPAAALGIESLRRQIATNDNFSANLNFVSGFLAQSDATLGAVSDLVIEAQSIASSQLGASSTPDERAAQAQVVNAMLQQALDLANRRYQNQAIVAGQNGTIDPFISVGGGYQYQGTSSPQGILTPTGGNIPYTLSGDDAFGAVSSQVIGYRDISPALTPATRLSDLGGATLKGVTPGPITLTAGATTVTADLSNAATINDVLTILNDAFASAGSDASVAISGNTLALTGDSTQTLTLADTQSGTTAADLGIASTLAPAAAFASPSLSPRITSTTPIAALNNGAGIDPAGIILSNGTTTATISLAGPPPLVTVEDLLNAINHSGTHVRAQIKSDGTGINLFNPLSGTTLRIGENGGNTADQLGIRSLNLATNLANFNNATGITPIANTLRGPSGQILVTTASGTTFKVAVDGVATPSQLIAAINGATGNTTVTAALNPAGNGITLTDTSGGAGNLTVAPTAGYISNGSDLGILKTGSGATLTGSGISLSTDDFRITRRDGSSFTVSLGVPSSVATVQDLLNRINTADGNTNPATQVTASLNSTGNGIQLSDASAGPGLLTVAALNASEAALQLGLLKTAPAGTPALITGDDQNPLQPQGLFSSLTLLRDSLLKNDNQGISQAATLLAKDGARVIKARGIVGAREKDVAGRLDDVTDEQTRLKQALSLLADTDFTEAATRFQLLQTAYQASLQVAQTTRNTSLLDFLR